MGAPLFLFLLQAGAAAAPPDRPPDPTIGGRLSGMVRLEGRVRVTEDLLVLPGATLVVMPGSELVFGKSESTKVDPEYFFGGTEIVVRGTLVADAAKFSFPDRTGGVVLDGGKATFKDVRISGAEAGLTILGGGSAVVDGELAVENCRTGLALFPGSAGALGGSGKVAAKGNAVGAVRFTGAPELPPGFRAEGSEEADVIAWDAPSSPPPVSRRRPPRASAGVTRIGDVFLDSDRTLQGDILVDGILRVAPGVTLTILPGARLFFTFRDTDGDGIGENGLFLQGTLRAKGTASRPIGFYPADGESRPGLWDSINFMASDRGENVLEHVEIEGAYRGVHAHFSRLSGKDVRIARCFRGVQFQESEVNLSDLRVSMSNGALRCRDSNVRIRGFSISDTASGGNFFRSRVWLDGARADRTGWYGFRFRESRVDWGGGEVGRSLVGISAQEGNARIDGAKVVGTGLAGVAVQDGDVTLIQCSISGSSLDGLSATRGTVAVFGGEIAGYGRHAVKLGGPAEVTLRGTRVSSGGGRSKETFFDGRVSPGLGVVRIE